MKQNLEIEISVPISDVELLGKWWAAQYFPLSPKLFFFFFSLSHQFYAASCIISEAPIDHASTEVRWQRTQNGPEGTLECTDGDYLYVGDNPALTCTGPGPWQAKEGKCKQRIWRNEVVCDNIICWILFVEQLDLSSSRIQAGKHTSTSMHARK